MSVGVYVNELGGDTHPVTTTQHCPFHDSAHAQVSCDFAQGFVYSLVLHGWKSAPGQGNEAASGESTFAQKRVSNDNGSEHRSLYIVNDTPSSPSVAVQNPCADIANSIAEQGKESGNSSW